jgi:protein-disulfide isomerase
MHDALFNSQSDWSGKQDAVQTFEQLAGNLGLDQPTFNSCLEGGKATAAVTAEYQEGIAAGITGTPAFRINGAAVSGAQPIAAFQQMIDYFLAGGEAPSMDVAADSFRSLGQADAPVVITEFSDYQ